MSVHSVSSPRAIAAGPSTAKDSPLFRAPLTLTCDECDGEGQVYRSRGGGNDPDGWLVRCEYCDGEGTVTPRCDGRGCHTVANETIRWPTGEVEHYCTRCAEQARADALIPGDVWGDGP